MFPMYQSNVSSIKYIQYITYPLYSLSSLSSDMILVIVRYSQKNIYSCIISKSAFKIKTGKIWVNFQT